MWELFLNCFNRYGRVNRTPMKVRGTFEWSIYAYLDGSFGFLLHKPTSIVTETSADSELFLDFLSGYSDAEGCLRAYGEGESSVVSYRINSEDEGILRDIRRHLSAMGYHVYLGLQRSKGTINGKTYRESLWGLGLFRKDEVIALANSLRFRHAEKIESARLISLSHEMKWSSLRPLVLAHREKIRSDVAAFVQEAMNQYHVKHSSSLPNQIDSDA
jgi:hypothetical protein